MRPSRSALPGLRSAAMIEGTMWPVLQRELREQARQNGTYWLRVIAAGVVILLFWIGWERNASGTHLSGRGYFLGLHRLLFLGIWLVAPILTADCLSREKREGTLGLLFLTPLRPVDVVVGKAFVYAIRGLVFVLAVIPIMVVPGLLGGVGWLDAVRMTFFQLAALGLALVAGLTASALTESWWRARILAFGFAVLAAGVLAALYIAIITVPLIRRPPVVGMPNSFGAMFELVWQGWFMRQGFFISRGFDGLWQDVGRPAVGGSAVRSAALVWLGSWLLVGVAVRIAASGVQRTWRQSPASARAQEVQRWLTQVPIGKRAWLRRRNAVLAANPVRWLQSRAWTSRVAGWLLLGSTSALTLAGFLSPRYLGESLNLLGRMGVLGAAAFVAAASFRQERESGALELWLVTPLTPTAVVRGRLAGLAAQFIPPSLILVFMSFGGWSSGTWLFAVWVAATLMFGVGLSLARLSFLTAFALAWVAHHAPLVVAGALDWLHQEAIKKWSRGLPYWNLDAFLPTFSLLLAVAVSAWGFWFARRQLAERRFEPGWSSADLSQAPKLPEVRPT